MEPLTSTSIFGTPLRHLAAIVLASLLLAAAAAAGFGPSARGDRAWTSFEGLSPRRALASALARE